MRFCANLLSKYTPTADWCYLLSGDDARSCHYIDVIMITMASQIISLTVVYSIVYSRADERKIQSSASLAFVRGIHRDRWNPRTKGQKRGKWFHLMTSSCTVFEMWISILKLNSPGPVKSPHKGPVTRKMVPFDDVIMHCVWNVNFYLEVGEETCGRWDTSTNLMTSGLVRILNMNCAVVYNLYLDA